MTRYVKSIIRFLITAMCAHKALKPTEPPKQKQVSWFGWLDIYIGWCTVWKTGFNGFVNGLELGSDYVPGRLPFIFFYFSRILDMQHMYSFYEPFSHF